ncbi:acetyl-CoA carboxylase biotin carboxyl carrier protein [Serpentinicella sp. ANB-PHB4]|uniref:acetyl-CoA carboxylase biotin carboxyl carrier protein n=1 Tax=Serpentinicella sp. ANB-PHB4 TaxID=3074076 RepID=UPI002861DB4A|nr:acetyl-CoA carboxylase biotin carboxyl carrier protein [Serpentinicella sp. ANB-PHB4]MDR5659088.1 acetyl-CoA carboxylase biotin carboxyl carrier protein [Serpentinicella sp. ANB-PHB4]
MDAKDIKDLILTIDKTSIENVEIEKNDIKITISKGFKNLDRDLEKTIETDEDIVSDFDSSADMIRADIASTQDQDQDIYFLKSPMVGSFYGAPSPDSEPFVKVGDRVEKGQTLCIVEAMKMMNEIKSEIAGEVVEVLIDEEDIVEYGQPLMRIRG